MIMNTFSESENLTKNLKVFLLVYTINYVVGLMFHSSAATAKCIIMISFSYKYLCSVYLIAGLLHEMENSFKTVLHQTSIFEIQKKNSKSF